MPYTWEMRRVIDLIQSTGSINSVAAQVITFASLPGGIAVGRLMEIAQSATNDGIYTVTNIAGNNVTVAEPINNSGASGVGTCTGPGAERIVGSGITSFPDDHTILASGAGFITNGVLKGDRIAVYGDAVNDGSYMVDRVQTEDQLTVVDHINLVASGALTASGASTGSILVSEGFGTVTISGEAVSSWAGLAGTYPYLVDGERPCGPTATLTVRQIPAINRLKFQTASGEASRLWFSQKEVVLPIRSSSFSINWNFDEVLGDPFIIVLGAAGTDADFGGQSGSYWFHGSFGGQGSFGVNYLLGAWASVLHGLPTLWYPGENAIVRNCLVVEDGGIFFEDGTDVENVTLTDANFGPGVKGGVVETADLSVLKTGALAALNSDTTIQDFRITNDTYKPVWWVFTPGITVTARDPKGDYSAAELFNLFNTSSGIVEYTWDPRFVSRDSTGLVGDPISGLAVSIYNIEAGSETEISGSPFTTNASGQIDTDIYLMARYKFGFFAPVEISQRIVVEGQGYRTLNQVIKMARPFEGDVAIDFLYTDFEGEVST